MKIAITGHTKGIGKGLANRLISSYIGFSRQNGYDISKAEDRQRIIMESNDCEIFINNAAAGFHQTTLLIELFRAWQGQNKTIINVGSRIAEIDKLPYNRLDLLEYQAAKIMLKEMSYRLGNENCVVKYKWFAYVGTEEIIRKYPHFTTSDYITVDQAVDIILS